jgi:uncharacterized protein YoxC
MLTVLNIVLLLLNAAFIGTGVYLSSYLKTKAEHLATREDFEELRQQTASLTHTAKEIEAKISGDLWDRQKQWELKRDVLFELARKAGTLNTRFTHLLAIYIGELANKQRGEAPRFDTRLEVSKEWNAAFTEFQAAITLSSVLCGLEVMTAASQLGVRGGELVDSIMEENSEVIKTCTTELAAKTQILTHAIRKELELRPSAPRSSAS